MTNETAQKLVENEWSIGLAGLTAEQIKNGINRARLECDWPPSISEFINLALDIPTEAEFIAEINGAIAGQLKDSGLMSLALEATRLTSWDLSNFSITDLNFWKREAYPLVVERLRYARLGI